MSDELTDLRARLEALAETWDGLYKRGVDCFVPASVYAAQLRALLAPPASVRCPDCGSDPVPSDKACPVCDRPAPVAEPPKCEECVSCQGSRLGRGLWRCNHSKAECTYCINERSDVGNCGPSGRLFKARGAG